MTWILRNLWLIPALPIFAAGISALLKRNQQRLSATLAIGSMSASLALALIAFAEALSQPARQVYNFHWLQFGNNWLSLGWLLDPLAAVMLVMVTFVGLLIFIYSTGYMAHDDNAGRFFCFLSLFAGAMLGVVIANSLLLLFMCWEVVGLTSYLLIGFWYHRPAAAAAAKKAFITTRIGDLGLLIGMVWLYAQSGTLLFYANGTGCLEQNALASMAAHTAGGIAVITAIGLLIFCGAVGKSGQVPLHVWLPDAMEGPTPVSALIHAATMVAAGVYLIARVYPLMSGHALAVVAWVGAITALFAACIAVAQNDIKRILAYSTVSQLGYMMLGLGVGGVAVGMFHLITHAFFKALLFLGAGSVIHGCTEEQDIRNMGGLRRFMPVTFATYSAGMLALCGFPLFAGFWSKDEILHSAHGWSVSLGPFYLGAIGALLTAFYMTRQMYYVFFGPHRLPQATVSAAETASHVIPAHEIEPVVSAGRDGEACEASHAHESPANMTVPLSILAIFAVFLGFVGTPAWPWFQSFLEGQRTSLDFGRFSEAGLGPLMVTSSLIVFAGLGLGWFLYGRKPIVNPADPDALERIAPPLFRALGNRLYVDEFYGATFIRLTRFASAFAAWLDHWIWGGAVRLVSWIVTGIG
ncbi:MAG TPA: NADH-quinone oxidoreductase subunit L, partial [Acidobacteriaceae bacterium]|nr:NADH-quinone oxidoreductase subunit L [Acidobacteriaceae bacterium]